MENEFPIPANENERLEALYSFNILDTHPEEQYDRLTQLASVICDVPISIVNFIDKDRQWFKSKIGINAGETHRNLSICQYAIMGDKIFEVEDAILDTRFKNNPLVTGYPYFRFYAGQPLIDNGFAYGTLCVMSDKPKKLNDTQKLVLEILAKEVVSQMNLRKKEKETEKLEKLFNMSIDMVCIAGIDGYFKKINPAFTHTLGYTEDELLSNLFIDFIHPDDVNLTLKEVEKLARGQKTIDFVNRYKTKSGEYKTQKCTRFFRPRWLI